MRDKSDDPNEVEPNPEPIHEPSEPWARIPEWVGTENERKIEPFDWSPFNH